MRGDGRNADDYRPPGADARQLPGQGIERAVTAEGAEGRAQVTDSQVRFHVHVGSLFYVRTGGRPVLR